MLKTLGEKKSYLEEQINSYHSYIDASMQTMQGGRKGKRRFVLPFSQQYFHLRSLKQNGGKVPKFGSYKYTWGKLVEKGVLVGGGGLMDGTGVLQMSSSGGKLSVSSSNPTNSIGGTGGAATGEVNLTISSDQAGIFTITILNGPSAGQATDLRIEDLLESQFNNQPTLAILDGMVEVNVNLLVHLINKKFYA